jgi:hypothetical protein
MTNIYWLKKMLLFISIEKTLRKILKILKIMSNKAIYDYYLKTCKMY